MSDERLVWPSGVGGAQCDECGETTIVRAFGSDFMGVPGEWLCRECRSGVDIDEGTYYDGGREQ